MALSRESTSTDQSIIRLSLFSTPQEVKHEFKVEPRGHYNSSPLTHSCNKLNLSYSYDSLTIYDPNYNPEKSRLLEFLCHITLCICLPCFAICVGICSSHIDLETILRRSMLMEGFDFYHRGDSNEKLHDRMHSDEYDKKNFHYHLVYRKTGAIPREKLNTILDLLVKSEYLSAEEKDAFFKKYDTHYTAFLTSKKSQEEPQLPQIVTLNLTL